LIEDAKLTKYQYEHIRMEAIHRNANIYPSYKKLNAAKKCNGATFRSDAKAGAGGARRIARFRG